jgi:hypothetical protein
MKKNYKLHKKVAGAGDRCRWGKEKDVLRNYFKLSIVNCQLLIVNEISTYGLLQDLNYKQITKGSHGLHKGSFKLQTMTALIKSFCGGVQGGQFFQKAPPLAAGG